MKKLAENEFSGTGISFENPGISVKKEILDNISIGIFGAKTKNNLRLKLALQSYGFFVRIMENSQEVLFAIEDNLVQMLLVSPESVSSGPAEDEFFSLCELIRKKNAFFYFPILLLLDKGSSRLVGKTGEFEINDFLVGSFDISVLLSRIQILAEQRRLYLEKQEILKSEREKSVLLYSVTHNVNIPLTILLNEIQSLNEIESGGKSVKNISESAREINLIIQNALDSYKISDGRYLVNKKILNLLEVLLTENSFLSRKAEMKNQVFEFECKSKNPRVFCDENSLKGIYANLVDNAIKYTKLFGKIKIIITEENDFLFLSVTDEGIGIPKEKRPHLFERFAQIGTKPTGQEKSCGLGLYVVNEICKLNDISLEYSENTDAESGSVFTLKFKKIG